jgi:hypothetical protein
MKRYIDYFYGNDSLNDNLKSKIYKIIGDALRKKVNGINFETEWVASKVQSCGWWVGLDIEPGSAR